MQVIKLPEIKAIIKNLDLIAPIEKAFAAHSAGKTVVPPVGELLFDDPPGDMHIKYGYLTEGDYGLVKIASGFYNNPQFGLSSSQGLMLLFDKQTGQPVCLLQDEGYLTNLRTAVAGAIAAKYCAPKKISAIGIVGTGGQAKCQLEQLLPVVDCETVYVYGRSNQKIAQFKDYFFDFPIVIQGVNDVSDVAENCNLIVTTTPSHRPILTSDMIKQGTHITAIGSDTPDKNELDPAILAGADAVVTDCKEQALRCGEVFCALNNSDFSEAKLVEIGALIANGQGLRQSENDITVADFTGIAPQDIAIAQSVFGVCK